MPIAKYRRPLPAVAFSLASVLALALSGLFSPRPAPRYTVTDLGVLPGYAESDASALNDRGEVTVTVSRSGGRQACVYRQGRLVGLGVVPGGSNAEGINAAGDVVGLTGPPGARRAFLHTGGRTHGLGALPGFPDCEGVSLNDAGEIAGASATSPGPLGLPHEHAFVCVAGKMTDIGTLPGFSEGCAVRINAAGLVTGEGYPAPGGSDRARPFLYNSRTKALTLLPVPPLTRAAYASRTTTSGQTIGTVWAGNGRYHAVLWAGGRMQDLGASPGFSDSMGTGLNDRGEAVGCGFEDGTAEVVRAFLRDHTAGALRRYFSRPTDRAFVCVGGRMQDLSALVPASAGWTLERAYAINGRGQIAGGGLHNGQKRAFLLTPTR